MSYKPDQIHETVIRDIIDLYDTIKNDTDIDEIRKSKGNNKYFKSIASATSNLTSVFPVLCTRSLQIENAAMVTKAIERKMTSMLQMLFASIQMADAPDAFSFLSQFHTNIDNKFITADDAIDIINKVYGEMSTLDSLRAEKMFNEMVSRDMRNLDYVLPENVSESAINDFRIVDTPAGPRIIKEDLQVTKFEYQQDRDAAIDKRNAERDAKTDEYNQKKLNLEREKLGVERQKAVSQIYKNDIDAAKAAQDMIRNQILDSDVKKANELVPTMLTVSFKSIDKDTDNVITVDQAVIGVKAKMYPIDSEDICNRILIKTHDKNAITNLVRATTREISFWKDFVFAIDRAKLDALSYSRKGTSSKIWKTLERRALKSKIRRAIGNKNDATAITTLVISQDEVEYMKKNFNIDIENASIARNLIESYNLIGMCIVDENVEVAKFLFDTGDDMWENVSFTHLERESSDNTYKRVVNLMTKMR